MHVTVTFDDGASLVFRDGKDLKDLRRQQASLTQEEMGARLRLPQPWVSAFERKIVPYLCEIKEELRERRAAGQ